MGRTARDEARLTRAVEAAKTVEVEGDRLELVAIDHAVCGMPASGVSLRMLIGVAERGIVVACRSRGRAERGVAVTVLRA
jgi:hypothetical protein